MFWTNLTLQKGSPFDCILLNGLQALKRLWDPLFPNPRPTSFPSQGINSENLQLLQTGYPPSIPGQDWALWPGSHHMVPSAFPKDNTNSPSLPCHSSSSPMWIEKNARHVHPSLLNTAHDLNSIYSKKIYTWVKTLLGSSLHFCFLKYYLLFLSVLDLHCCVQTILLWWSLSCGAWASHCGDFSLCKARGLGYAGSVVATYVL